MSIIDGNGFNPLNSQPKKQGGVGQQSTNPQQNKTTPAQGQTATPEVSNDQSVQISSAGRQLNQLEKEMVDTKAFQEEKVNLIKQAIDDGTYKPNPAAIAKKMAAFDQSF